MQRLRPDDQFMLLMESDATPMQIGALLILDVPAAQRGTVFTQLRAHFVRRLRGTPLACVLHPCPALYDSPVWLDAPDFDADEHIIRGPRGLDDRALRAFGASFSLKRLDLAKPPFQIIVIDELADGHAAVLLKVHHALTDGVGFQTILGLLSDGDPTPPELLRGAARREAPPPPALWLARSAWRLTVGRPQRRQAAARRAEALATLKAWQAAHPRSKTPTLKLSGPTSAQRDYATLSLDFETIRAAAKNLGGTINDLFLAIGAGALRDYLREIGDLPASPLVANSARSYRRPEHGLFGNRIVAMHPALATHIDDPIERLRAIQASMEAEKQRTHLDEALLDQPEIPFGPRDRKMRFAQRAPGAALLPGNVTLSNVPGPSRPRSMSGFRQVANFPIPLLGSGRFLNITSRRNGDHLDLGIMADPCRISDLGRLVTLLSHAFEVYVALGADPTLQAAADHVP